MFLFFVWRIPSITTEHPGYDAVAFFDVSNGGVQCVATNGGFVEEFVAMEAVVAPL